MYAVIGLGKTGLSILRYLQKKQIPCWVCDTRENPPGLAELQTQFPHVAYFLNGIPEEKLLAAEKIILSPGLPRSTALLQKALHLGISVVGDVELFAEEAKAPVIAITGTNAKGTVTSMLSAILTTAGKTNLVGANFGTPALDLLNEAIPDYYVLELSSFQLENIFSLRPIVATILNISPDHLDYHGSLENYIKAKQRIYEHSVNIVYNHDDLASYPPAFLSARQLTFGLAAPSISQHFGVKNNVLIYQNECIMPISDLPVKGVHNWLNALAASALAVALSISMESIQKGLQAYQALHYRCEWVRKINGVDWFNDSKGTNVGATKAAILGLGPIVKGGLILLAGGQGKEQDFSLLQDCCAQYVKALILFGQDALTLKQALSSTVEKIMLVKDLIQAVNSAQALANDGDAVLLSPACASLDMFKSYEDRGQQFNEIVRGL